MQKAIPIGKALVPIEQSHYDSCEGCFFLNKEDEVQNFQDSCFACYPDEREDGKSVIYQLVEIQEKKVVVEND